jgi:hypothetical protein
MRKPFGILLLLIGLAMVIGEILNLKRQASPNYRDDKSGEKQQAYTGLIIGVLASISGAILLWSHGKKKAERAELLKVLSANSSAQLEKNNPQITDDKITQIEKLGKLKEQGLLTDEEFDQQKRKILEQ